jgi:cbb3-type cytochrome oxidase subunit 3
MFALVILLMVFFVCVLAIVGFVFPPSKWLEWFYGAKKKD